MSRKCDAAGNLEPEAPLGHKFENATGGSRCQFREYPDSGPSKRCSRFAEDHVEKLPDTCPHGWPPNYPDCCAPAEPEDDPSEPEAPQRDRWDEAAVEFRLRDTDECSHFQIDPYQCPQCIADRLRAAYQQGQKDEREACAQVVEEHQHHIDFGWEPGTSQHMEPPYRCIVAEAIRSRAQEEPKR